MKNFTFKLGFRALVWILVRQTHGQKPSGYGDQKVWQVHGCEAEYRVGWVG